jgi:hypothetical protein
MVISFVSFMYLGALPFSFHWPYKILVLGEGVTLWVVFVDVVQVSVPYHDVREFSSY